MTGPVTVRRIADDPGDLADLVAVFAAVTPEDPTSLEELTWMDRVYPGTTRHLAATADGRVVGAGTVGRIFVYPEDHPTFWASIVVVPEARRQGVGSAILAALSADAAAAGKTGLEVRAFADRPEGLAFLEHHGYAELERSRMVRLELIGRTPPPVDLPDGLHLATLAERPELVGEVHEVAIEAFDDIPGGDTPMAAGDLAEFRARDVDRPGIDHGAFMLALDEATGRVIGYASLMFVPGSTTVAWHDMTAVRGAWRGRGVATALKRATIGWAIEHGLTALDTGNDEDNAAMRAVNARLGYVPLPDELTYRGPLVALGAPVDAVTGTVAGERAS
jgi:GNAT superfamily N-acetyltransferase